MNKAHDMEKPFCPACRKATEVVLDHASGDTVCAECGLNLVPEPQAPDESPEWRTFSDSPSSGPGGRVAAPATRLTDVGTPTFKPKPNDARLQKKSSNPDRSLIVASRSIGTLPRLGLVPAIKDRANEIYKKIYMEDFKSMKGRSPDATLAACLYIACRQEDKQLRAFKDPPGVHYLDHVDPEKDSVIKAEELATELFRDAMEMHSRLVLEEMTAASGKGNYPIAETKETCGDIMYANGRDQLNRRAESVSLSQTSQCSDTPGSQEEGAHLEGALVIFSNPSGGLPEEHKANRKDVHHDGDRHFKMKGFVDTTTLEKEIAAVRESNVRKQAKIDSLQKWRSYYQATLEKKDRVLEKLERKLAKETMKTDKAMKKAEKAHAKDLATLDAKREEMEEKLRCDIKKLHLVIEELSEQLYDMEEHLAAGGIPYKPTVNENAGPSSKTLLSAVIGVKEAAHTFSRTFMSFLKLHLTKARDLDEQICLESEVIVARPSDYKFLVQSFILRRMFLDFDSECFNIDTCMTEIFDIEDHSRACFQEYMSHRSISDAVTLLTDNRPHSAFLREFCFKKFLHIVSESTEEAFFGDFNHSDDICAGRHPSSRFYESYCRLAVSVWLLHRLAFSFQPPARMISVRKGAQFNPAYMESAVPGICSDSALGDGGAALPFEALVGLMVHPGFRIGTSVVRAQVYLVTT